MIRLGDMIAILTVWAFIFTPFIVGLILQYPMITPNEQRTLIVATLITYILILIVPLVIKVS